MKIRSGRFILDTGVSRYLGRKIGSSRSLWQRPDGQYFVVDEDQSTGKILTEKAAWKCFWKANREVHNFKWLFQTVFQMDWKVELIRSKKRARRA